MRKAAAALCLLLAAGLARADDPALCRLPEKNLRSDVGLGFPRKHDRLPTIGEVHLTVLFADFPDVPADMTPEQVLAMVSPKAEAFYADNSYGKLKLVLDPYLHWTHLDRPSGDFHFHRGSTFFEHRAYLQAVIDQTPGADYAKAQGIVVITNPKARIIDYGPAFTAAPGFGVTAGGREFLNGATSGSDLPGWGGWGWFNHEIGHAMSLIDLAGPAPENQRWNTYVGDFSAMGSPSAPARGYLGWERWQLGWLEDSQVICRAEPGFDAALSPIEEPGGDKIVVVPVTATRAVVIENRQAEGFDEPLYRSGLLVYVVDTALGPHQGAIRIAPHSPGEEHYVSALLAEGQSVQVEGLAVTATGGGGLRVEKRAEVSSRP